MNHFKNNLKILLIVCVLCAPFTTIAQDFAYGLKAGLNISSLKFENSDYSTKSSLGVNLGVFGNLAISEKFAIQPELLFSTGASTYTYNPLNTVGDASVARRMAGSVEVEAEINTSHLSLPVMLQYKITNALYIEAGPQYNLLLSIKENYDGNGNEDIKEYYKSGTFGVGVGVGYDIASLVNGLKVGLRYTRDISEMNKEELQGGNLKSSMFQIGLAYAFGN